MLVSPLDRRPWVSLVRRPVVGRATLSPVPGSRQPGRYGVLLHYCFVWFIPE